MKGQQKSRRKLLTRLDLPGSILFVSSVIMLLLALQWGGTKYAWNSATVVGLFCGAGGTFFSFLGWEDHLHEDALIPLSLFTKRVVCCSCVFMSLFFGTFLIYSYYLPVYFQAAKGVTPTLSGVYILPTILSAIVAVAIAGSLSRLRPNT